MIIDLSQVDLFASAGLGALVEIDTALTGRGVAGPRPRVRPARRLRHRSAAGLGGVEGADREPACATSGSTTCGTLLVAQGVHIRAVQEILGHSDVRTTEGYTHVASEIARDAAARMGRTLWGTDDV